jgi:hypothetical protein
MESMRIAHRREQAQRMLPRRTGTGPCCPTQKLPDKPNILESQRVLKEQCPTVYINHVPKVVVGSQTVDQKSIYVVNTYASNTTDQIKDALIQAQINSRFYEFLKPRPLPPDFLQVPRAPSNGGEPVVLSVCRPGEIKTVG